MNTINPETGEVTPRSIKAVATKIAMAMANMEAYAPKDGTNKHFGYDFTSISQYVSHVRPSLVKHGLVIVPSLLTLTDSGDNITDVVMKYTIIDKDSGEYIEVVMQGRGQDASKDGRRLDKGPYKAYSGAFKYFLAETFMIASGDDPDETSGQGQKSAASQGQSRNQTPKEQPASENGKGKIADTPMTKYWLEVRKINLDQKRAQEILAQAGGDAVKALTALTTEVA